MSRSRPQIQNPALKFYEWKNGTLEHYDKEKQERIKSKLPFTFLVLDQVHGITGYSDNDQSGFWSNETRSTKDDFTVRTKRGIKYVGPYKNSQGIPQVPTGARYGKIVYFAHQEAGDWHIARMMLSGVALTAFIELSGSHNVENGKLTLTGSVEGKKGATVYQIPVFEYSSSTTDEDKMALSLDKVLQNYLVHYLTVKPEEDLEEHARGNDVDNMGSTTLQDSFNTNNGKATPEQLADFEKRKADKLNKKQLDANDFPDDDAESQSLYNSIASGEDIPFDDGDLPPEFRG